MQPLTSKLRNGIVAAKSGPKVRVFSLKNIYSLTEHLHSVYCPLRRRPILANTKSTKKRIRQNEKVRLLNRKKKGTVRTFEKRVRKFVEEVKITEAVEAYKSFSSSIDKAAKTNLIHKNTANRKKARLAKLIASAGTSTNTVAPSPKVEVAPVTPQSSEETATTVES